MKDFTAWIAISAQGHPAPFIGFALTRKQLTDSYRRRYISDFDEAGYRAIQVRVAVNVPIDEATMNINPERNAVVDRG